MSNGSAGPRTLRLGTRRSNLARTQSSQVAAAITAATGHPVELVEVTTHGDVSREHLTQIGGNGVFVAALREALLAGEVDLAVHSLKDLPTAPEAELVIAAVPARVDPRDALVARDGLTLGELPAGARLGTGAPRRAAQVRALGFGLDLVPVRGNVDTRLALVRDGVLDGVLLARAGLLRLGRADEATEVLDPLQMLPAPGQGALAVECRAADADLVSALGLVDDPDSRATVTAERALLAALEAGCTAPVGALAEVVESLDAAGAVVLELSLRAVVSALDGSHTLRRSACGALNDPAAVGRALAAQLFEDGAGAVLADPPERPPRQPAALALDLSTDEHSPERAS